MSIHRSIAIEEHMTRTGNISRRSSIERNFIPPPPKRSLANAQKLRRFHLTELRGLVAAQNIQKLDHSHTLMGIRPAHHEPRKARELPDRSCAIPGLRQNPKILWADDAKIIGDGIAEALPVLGDFVAQEIERGVRKLSACGVAFVVRDVLVHDSP